jgi:hypothetical protein
LSDQPKKITLHAPPSVNSHRLKQYWRSHVANVLAESLGLPLPASIEVQTDDKIDQSTLRLEGLQFLEKSTAPSSQESLSPSDSLVLALDNELERGEALVLMSDINKNPMSDINKNVKKFMSVFKGAWNERQLSEIQALVVPRWSFPLWKAQGVPLHAPELATAIALRDELLRRPHAALSRGATVFLLNRVRTLAHFSVDEALARISHGPLDEEQF